MPFLDFSTSIGLQREKLEEVITHFVNTPVDSIPDVPGIIRAGTVGDQIFIYLKYNNKWNIVGQVSNNILPPDRLYFNPDTNNPNYDSNFPANSAIFKGKFLSFSKNYQDPNCFAIDIMGIDDLYVKRLYILESVQELLKEELRIIDQYVEINKGITSDTTGSPLGTSGIRFLRGSLDPAILEFDNLLGRFKITDPRGTTPLYKEVYISNTFPTISSEDKAFLFNPELKKMYYSNNGTWDIISAEEKIIYKELISSEGQTTIDLSTDLANKTLQTLEVVVSGLVFSSPKDYNYNNTTKIITFTTGLYDNEDIFIKIRYT